MHGGRKWMVLTAYLLMYFLFYSDQSPQLQKWLHADWIVVKYKCAQIKSPSYPLRSVFPSSPSQLHDHTIDWYLLVRHLTLIHTPIWIVLVDRRPELGSIEWFCQARVDSICLNPFSLVAFISLFVSLHSQLCTMSAHTIPVDLLMDLIAFQLIASHASSTPKSNWGPIHEPHHKFDSAWHHKKVILTTGD